MSRLKAPLGLNYLHGHVKSCDEGKSKSPKDAVGYSVGTQNLLPSCDDADLAGLVYFVSLNSLMCISTRQFPIKPALLRELLERSSSNAIAQSRLGLNVLPYPLSPVSFIATYRLMKS